MLITFCISFERGGKALRSRELANWDGGPETGVRKWKLGEFTKLLARNVPRQDQERFLSAQADAFAGAKCGRKSRAASFEMTAANKGRGGEGTMHSATLRTSDGVGTLYRAPTLGRVAFAKFSSCVLLGGF